MSMPLLHGPRRRLRRIDTVLGDRLGDLRRRDRAVVGRIVVQVQGVGVAVQPLLEGAKVVK